MKTSVPADERRRRAPAHRSRAAAPSPASAQDRARVRGALGRGDDPARAIAEQGLHSPSQPLDAGARAALEPRLGHGLGAVRIHAGADAGRSALELKASAYTVGEDVVFAPGKYRPGTAAGQRLLAHELSHVVQQRRSPAPSRELGSRGDPDERWADRVAGSMGWGSLSSRYLAVAGAFELRAEAGTARAGEAAAVPATAAIQRVELSYDDGPDTAGNTATVLQALNAAGARATFYLVGKRVA